MWADVTTSTMLLVELHHIFTITKLLISFLMHIYVEAKAILNHLQEWYNVFFQV